MNNIIRNFGLMIIAVAMIGFAGCGNDENNTDIGGNDDVQAGDTNVPDGVTEDRIQGDTVEPGDLNGTDTNGTDTNGTDTNVPEDTNGTDTNGTDTNVPEDTNGTDTNGTDTNVPEDTNGTDTNGTDTNVPEDTNVVDVTEPPDCPAGQTIAALLALTEGTVDATLCGVVVTKVSGKGWFIADDSTTHGLYIYEGTNPDWGYTVAAGDYVTMHVTKFENYQGTQQITGKDGITVQGKANVADYILNLSVGTLPTEEIESRVVIIDDVRVSSETGKAGTIDYGTATNVLVYVDYNEIPCVGLTADIVAGVVTQFNAAYQIKLTDETDLINADISTCETPVEYDDSNWDFEKQSVEEDPPEGFLKGAGNTYTCVRTADGGAGGTAGITITWTSDANQDLVAGYKIPTAEGEAVMFALDVLDNDVAGKARLGLSFYDAAGAFITGSNSWMVDGSNNAVYSVDSATFQSLTWEAVAPANAVTAEGKLRMYDESSAWDGNATITIDNWEMISVAP